MSDFWVNVTANSNMPTLSTAQSTRMWKNVLRSDRENKSNVKMDMSFSEGCCLKLTLTQLRRIRLASEDKTHAYERTKVMKDAAALKKYYGLNTKTCSGIHTSAYNGSNLILRHKLINIYYYLYIYYI